MDLLQDKKAQLIGISALAIIGITIAFFSTARPSASTISGSDFPLGKYAATITGVRLASAKNALDGTGEFTEDQCNELGNLVKEYNKSSDYISCSSPKLLYLDTPDTSDKRVLTISDEKYTATFTTDKEIDNLIDYTFLQQTSGGFNSYEGR